MPLCAYKTIRDREGRKRDMGGSMLYVSMCHCVPTTRLETEGRGTAWAMQGKRQLLAGILQDPGTLGCLSTTYAYYLV